MTDLTMVVNKTLDALVRELTDQRKAAGLTQQELARRSGIKQGTISQIERRCHDPYLQTYLALMMAINEVQAQNRRKASQSSRPQTRTK